MAVTELTQEQSDLSRLLKGTNVPDAKITRRLGTPGNWQFETDTRDIGLLGFSERPGEFALKAHESNPDLPLSPFYFSFRNLAPEVYQAIVEVMAQLPYRQWPDAITGIPNAGDPIAEYLARQMGIPYVPIFDKEVTAAGRKIIPSAEALAHPPVAGKNRLLIVDDLISQANTKIESIVASRIAQYEVVGVGVVLDREQGGLEELAKVGCDLYAALPLMPMMRDLRASNDVTADQLAGVRAYIGK